MRWSFAVGGIVAFSLALGATAAAQSSCDAGVTKAIAKKVSCKLKIFAMAQQRGVTADGAKLARCEDKFAATCAKAKSRNDCQAQTSSCTAIEAAADQAVDDLRGTSTTSSTTTSTTTTTLDPLRPCGRDPDQTCGGTCERGTCGAAPLNGDCVCLRPCGRESNGTCGGVCDFYPAEGCVEDQSGNCVCFLPCQPFGGIGQCARDCADPTKHCTFTGVPSAPCACF